MIVRRLLEFERRLEKDFGFKLEAKRILDLGAGQRLNQLAYFSLHNDAVGIDADLVVQGLDLPGYFRMLRTNGARRTLKTVARKLLLIDIRYRRELARQLHVDRIPPLRVLVMDAEQLAFPDGSFDLVYSQSVFSHLSAPARVLQEIVRVLRPGGVVYLDFLLYTARTGCMDVRVLGGRDAGLPLWAHLRPAHQRHVRGSAYLNKIRLAQWRELFESTMPDAQIVLNQPERERLDWEARHLHELGELLDYSLDELLTSYLTVLWQKPSPENDEPVAMSSDTVTSS